MKMAWHRTRRIMRNVGGSWKMRLVVAVVTIVGATAQNLTMCCEKAVGTCHGVCEKMSRATDSSAVKDEQIHNIYKFCPHDLTEFWICMNQTVQALISGSGWWGGVCCSRAWAPSCRNACARAGDKQALAPACRLSDETALYDCVQRQQEAQWCCSQTGSVSCHEACQNAVWQIGLSQIDYAAKSRALDICDQSPELMQCLRELTTSTVHDDTSRYLPCCNETASQKCRSSCESILRQSGESQEIAGALSKDCGAPALHEALWQCFLRKDATPDTKDIIPHDVAKLHCCQKAATINCKKLCFNTFNTGWQSNWQTFYAECYGDPQEMELTQCIEEVEAPCALGCSGLTFCSHLNNRVTSLFRSCTATADLAAHRAQAEHGRDQFVSLAGYRLPIRNSSECDIDLWKSVSCALHVKPCTTKGHSSAVCWADCVRLVAACVWWERAAPALSARALCARLAAPPRAPACLAAADYVTAGEYCQGHSSAVCWADCVRLVAACVWWERAAPALSARALCARLAAPPRAPACLAAADYVTAGEYCQGHSSAVCWADCVRLVAACVWWERAAPALSARALCARLAAPPRAPACLAAADYVTAGEYCQGHSSAVCWADCVRLVAACVWWERAAPALSARALCARLAAPPRAPACLAAADYVTAGEYCQGHSSAVCWADCVRLVAACVWWERAAPALSARALCARLAAPPRAPACLAAADYVTAGEYCQGHSSAVCWADCVRLVAACVWWERAAPALSARALCARLAAPPRAPACLAAADYVTAGEYCQGHSSAVCWADCVRLVAACVWWERAAPALSARALCARLAAPPRAPACLAAADYVTAGEYCQGHSSAVCWADCVRLVAACVWWERAAPALSARALCARLAAPPRAPACLAAADYVTAGEYCQGHSSAVCWADCVRLVAACVWWERAAPALSARALCARLAAPPRAPACLAAADYVTAGTEPPLLSAEEMITSPCTGNPCNSTQVCVVNRHCRYGDNCARYSCIDGCPMGDNSPVIIPLGSWARVPMKSTGNNACYKICSCGRRGLTNCQPLPCVLVDSCRLLDKEIESGGKYYLECNPCACVSGERVCSRRVCTSSRALSGLPCNCPPHYLPVGIPGRSFPNACLAKCAGAADAQLQFGARGGCGGAGGGGGGGGAGGAGCARGAACAPRRAPALHNSHARAAPQHICVNTSHCAAQPASPACDSSGVTHTTACHLFTSGRKFAYWGHCLTGCNKFGTVCGVNGVTYISECAAWAEYVSVDYSGECAAVGHISDKMEPKCQIDNIVCPPLKKPKCQGFTPPGACCPKCGGALRILYSRKQIDRALYGTNMSAAVINLENIIKALDRHIKIAECALRGFLTIETEIFISVETILEDPTDLQLHVCVLEAEKLGDLINRDSAFFSSDLGLSALSYALTVHTYPTQGASYMSVSGITIVLATILPLVLR